MPASSEKTDSVTRVTRSMRRLNSESDTGNDLDNRPETPTSRLKATKKLDLNNDSGVLTPTKRATRASSATRSLLEEVISSPLRRTTRRMSSERELTASPMRARSTRRSNQNLNESDDECVFVSEQQATPRTMKAGRNKGVVKLEEVLEEEPEINNKLNTSADSNKLDTSVDRKEPLSLQAEMELAEKDKSTNGGGGNKALDKSCEDIFKDAQNDPNNTNDIQSQGNDNIQANGNGPVVDSPSKRPSQKSIITSTIEEQMEVDLSMPTIEESPHEHVEITVTQTEKVIEYQIENMMQDFVAEDDDDKTNETTENNDVDKSCRIVEIEMESPTKKSKRASQSLVVETQSPQKSPAKKVEKSAEKVKKSAEKINLNASSEKIQKSVEKPKSAKRVSWNASIAGTSDRIDNIQNASDKEDEQISVPVNRKLVISSDESEDEEEGHNLKSLFFHDEAEVADSEEDSITLSEREYLDQNEIVDDGESLGSQDSDTHYNDIDDDDLMGDDEEENSFIDDDENIENEYSLDSEEEMIEKESPKRRSRIISSPSDSEEEKEIFKSPPKRKSVNRLASSDSEQEQEFEKSPPKSAKRKSSQAPSNAIVDVENLFKTKSPKDITRLTISGQFQEEEGNEKSTSTSKSRRSVPKNWRQEEKESENDENTEEVADEAPVNVSVGKQATTSLERKRKRESIVHGNVPKRFKEMSPNESEAVHMENVEMEVEEEIATTPPADKKVKKIKDPSVDIPKLLDRCEEYLGKHDQELKAKLALKRQQKKEKMLLKKKDQAAAEESADQGENKENTTEKKKKKKSKSSKQKLLSQLEPEKDDMATKLSKRQEILQQKRERKKLKRELKAAKAVNSADNDATSAESDSQQVQKIKTKKTAVEQNQKKSDNKPKKKKQKANDENVPQVQVIAEKSEKPKKNQKQSAAPAEPVVVEKKSKKRRIDEVISQNDDDEVIGKPKAKKKLNILQIAEDASQRLPSHNVQQQRSTEDNVVLSTVSSKLKKLIPTGLDAHSKKLSKKKLHAKVIPEPKISLPRPVWTSAGTFIEESVQPYKFKPTVYKPLNVGGSTEFRVIPFEAKSKKGATAAIPKNSKMDLLMQRNNKGRDKTMKNFKNLI